jgi:hypothetical protein
MKKALPLTGTFRKTTEQKSAHQNVGVEDKPQVTRHSAGTPESLAPNRAAPLFD